MRELKVTIPGGYARESAILAVKHSGLPSALERLAAGPFGLTSPALFCLEALVSAVDLGLAAAENLRGLILAEAAAPGSFSVPVLTADQRQLVSAFQLITTADLFLRRAGERVVRPPVSGALDLDGLPALLENERPPSELASHLLALARAYVEQHAADEPERACEALLAFVALLRAALLDLTAQGRLRPLLAALATCAITVEGHSYDGLKIREKNLDASGLLPVRPEDVVGNDDFLQAGLRLARDVAGYDFAARKNPKRLNPILFGLGRPGSGKTIAAHAIGNSFLDFCRERGVPAKFVVVRRTDWASSYQNASALNLVRIFREEVYGFEGVAGVYWPDIDTAFASRAADELRMEEKQNLAAVFGVFDGTLLPKDGRWFLICDANHLHMDEATISRIAQNPIQVHGPRSVEEYVRLFRDILLKDLRAHLPGDEEAWQNIGERARALDLSGRSAEAIAGNVRAFVQDFEYPDEYFRADARRRAEIIAASSRAITGAQLLEHVEAWARFHRDAERRAEEERFGREVEVIVRRLNAAKTAEALSRE